MNEIDRLWQRYAALAHACSEQHRATGRIDPALKGRKGAAWAEWNAAKSEEARKQKAALQETYIRSFPEAKQAEVRLRLREPQKYAAEVKARKA